MDTIGTMETLAAELDARAGHPYARATYVTAVERLLAVPEGCASMVVRDAKLANARREDDAERERRMREAVEKDARGKRVARSYARLTM